MLVERLKVGLIRFVVWMVGADAIQKASVTIRRLGWLKDWKLGWLGWLYGWLVLMQSICHNYVRDWAWSWSPWFPWLWWILHSLCLSQLASDTCSLPCRRFHEESLVWVGSRRSSGLSSSFLAVRRWAVWPESEAFLGHWTCELSTMRWVSSLSDWSRSRASLRHGVGMSHGTGSWKQWSVHVSLSVQKRSCSNRRYFHASPYTCHWDSHCLAFLSLPSCECWSVRLTFHFWQSWDPARLF